MEFEVLKRSHLKRNIIIGVVVVAIISAIILTFTRAKYRTSYSVPLINGTINYSAADLNIVAITVDGEEVDTIPTGNYELTEESYCEVNGVRDDSVDLSYDMESQMLTVTPMTTKGTKCYLYFNKKQNAGEGILANYTNQLTRSDFNKPVTDTTTGTIYYADTSKGRTYYFAGNPTDNWVRFAGFYWRIIRINEDGSIRMIYNGTSMATTGTTTQVTVNGSNTSVFSSTYQNNAYVGYMYMSQQVHGLTNDSTIKGVLDQWYQTNLANYTNQISTEAGFCGDRQPSTRDTTSNGRGGIGTTQTYYGAYIRLANTLINPTFDCENESDLYTVASSSQGNNALDYPIGLITADEVIYAGGVFGNNTGYYLYTSESYWTMSPSYYSTGARVFRVLSGGQLNSSNSVDNTYGVRPVINLSPNVTITGGNGTVNSPFEVAA